ncbi:winged helix-turn-helix transcriptional regulator [Streptomyces aidingensis]|uniref:DNA-binding transcriptional regulator, HxlR family n=1 Tax=Streptomyces aidingensis TaxID=910347 RepID=A0A1I1K0N0_9ACTN|nr:winged helix-turn-helix transcriptional regulator [Streptomyces aidingensis]SFC54499.1 DNA-binding transcriptional regulator, HxlR family [Streptomyces aidingensis]
MATNRSYQDACGAAHALDLVGERWALLVVRELLLGPKRYSDLKEDLPGISTNVLATRLSELERHGVLHKTRLPPPSRAQVYRLTPWGLELEPVIRQIGRWGARSPSHRPDAHLSVATFILSLRTNFDARRAAGADLLLELRLGEHRFRATVADGGFEVIPGPAEGPHAVLDGTPKTLASLVYGGRPPAEAEAAGELRLSGDRAAAERFLSCFTLPAPAGPAPGAAPPP